MSVLIVLGSKSDSPVAKKAVDVLEEFKVEYQMTVASAHRTPERVRKLAQESKADVIIAIAGLSAALPGVLAAESLKPVIGVPVSGKVNLDSILSIVQMPPGIPVGAVGLDNGKNAAILAVEILAIKEPALVEKLENYRKKQAEAVERHAAELSV